MKPLITNIQRFCVHDGPGIRTTVFFKGCSLHCPWCANPENMTREQEYFIFPEKCFACDEKDYCQISEKVKSKIENKCYEYGAIKKIGKYISPIQLYEELIKDRVYWGDEGGVTFSGGEALLFLKKYELTLNLLKERNINIAIETALNISTDAVIWATKYVDRFYVDVKTLDAILFRKLFGGEINTFKKNIAILTQNFDLENITFRVPISYENFGEKSCLLMLKQYFDEIGIRNVEIFSVHNLAKAKYERLGISFKHYRQVEKETLEDIRSILEGENRVVKILYF